MTHFFNSKTLKAIFLLNFIFISILLSAQIPTGYYDDAIGKSDTALQIALHNIIKGHNGVGYGNVPNHHQTTDKKPNGKVWDMYSDVPGGTPPYQFTFITDKCGNYSQEGDCYNREHSFPQSWFGSNEPMQSDLFHVYPTDGYVNGKRSNWPFTKVDNPTWTSQNGSKLGPSASAGYSGTGFEPIDEYKGDFARTYFYMAVRYYSEDNSWDNNSMVDGSQLKPWALQQLYLWHLQDTVSQKEIDRNNAVYQIQGNRNPFIDRPDWVDSLWFPAPPPNGLKELQNFDFQIYPNPTSDALTLKFSESVKAKLCVRDMQGRLMIEMSVEKQSETIIVENWNCGIYSIELQTPTYFTVRKFVVSR